MIQSLSVPVSVEIVFDHRQKTVTPRRIFWNGRIHRITQVGLRHSFREGRSLFHIFSVTSGQLSFRLKLATDTLFWTLEAISDGQPD